MFGAFATTSKSRYIFLCDMDTGVSRWSQNAVDFFGLPGEYMEDANAIWKMHIHPEDREAYAADIDAVFARKKDRHEMEYRAKDRDGNYVVCTCRGVVIKDDTTNLSYFAGTITNHGIIQNIDATTNLYNLYEFLHALKLIRDQNKSSIVLTFGPKHYSDINSIYGYGYGNRLLRHIASDMLEKVKGKGKIYRMDGTKFAIITTSMSLEEVKMFYDEIQEYAKHDIVLDGNNHILDVCGGVVVDDNPAIDAHTIYACARYAIESSKNEKHSELVIFNNDNASDNKKTIELINMLRSCVLGGCDGFYMCYQPVVSADNERLTGMEALVRWNKAPFGEISPAVFIPLLESDAVFAELGNWILKQAFIEGRAILEEHPDFIMNVNLSYTQLERKDFRTMLINLLETTGFPPQNLCLELTERCRLLDMNFLRNEVYFLKSQGIKIALDDFGTGFSSLTLLRELPVDCIKIDRGFVTEIEKNAIDQSIVKAVTNCARELSIRVCVEGIENEQMKEYMRKFPSSTYQGYYYSRPVRIEEFKRLTLY